MFLSPSGKPWGDSEPDKVFLRDTYAAAGLARPGVLWHSLRHTYASILAAGGIREEVVAVLMGHKRQGTTALYSHLFADAFDGVEEALDAALGVNQASTDAVSPPDTGGNGASAVSARLRMGTRVPAT